MGTSAIEPRHVAMLVQGDEVYGVGTVERLYAENWPEMMFVSMGTGYMYDWLREREARVELVEGLSKMRLPNTIAAAKLPVAVWRARRGAQRIHERLAGRGVRIIHAHWRPQQFIAGYMRRLGYRAVWHIHNNMSWTRLLGFGRKLNHLSAYLGADLILPVSDFIGANWRGCGVPIRTVRNSAVAIYDAPNAPPADGPVCCLAAGRLEESKGHHVAIDAVLQARRGGANVTLDVFGGPLEDNRYADELRAQVRTAGADAAVRFMGFCSDLRQRHRDYHLGLQCRVDPEPCSIWVCETLVDGLPLLASASGGTPELVADGETGYLYTPGSASELTDRLLELDRDRQKLAQMARAAFERGQREFTVARFLDETLSAYNSIVADE